MSWASESVGELLKRIPGTVARTSVPAHWKCGKLPVLWWSTATQSQVNQSELLIMPLSGVRAAPSRLKPRSVEAIPPATSCYRRRLARLPVPTTSP